MSPFWDEEDDISIVKNWKTKSHAYFNIKESCAKLQREIDYLILLNNATQ